MIAKKYLLLVLILIIGCEPDDICIEGSTGTSELIIIFHDINNPDDRKEIQNLNVVGSINQNDFESLFFTASDSITLPLRKFSSSTNYRFILNNDNNMIIDELTIFYTPKDIFINRACGFKTIFEELNVSNSNNWIKNIVILNNTLSSNNNANIRILH
uniref:Lipoprotein n=1 Tax=uncultured Flavobacteriia bacterium TaxID=212695 RepID=F4MML3_9BACT|nr:hypothetical protein [uncultured bacterium]CBL87376.1 conserved hypothetical protein [uncultured Flavobacteriia bacterium]